MKIYDLKDEAGRTFAFEVLNFGRHRVCRFVSKMPGVKIIKRQKHFQLFSPEEFCEFEFMGKTFVVWEPYGDSSRFWIGHEPLEWCPEIDEVRNAFALHRAFWLF